jgi:hypothetical protein
MFFLLRMAFWVSVVLVLVPVFVSKDDKHTAPESVKVNASEAVSAAVATISDLRNFCTRQPDACVIGAQAASAFGEKAQAGARILYDYAQERLAAKESHSVETTAAHSTKSADDKPTGTLRSRDTLTPADLSPQWHVPMPRPAPGSRNAS